KFMVLLVLGLAVLGLAIPDSAEAIPAWARRYNAACTMCHTMYPQLNSFGYKFRRLGYRTPKEFDQKDDWKLPAEELSKFTNYFSARGRPRVLYTNSKEDADNLDFRMFDVTLFYAGPVTRNLGFFFELPFEPDENKAFLEVGEIHANFGDSDHFFFTRFGQMHQFSRVGAGGLDRPIGLSNARVFEDRINGFRPRHDGIGVDFGYSANGVTALIQATNGIEANGGSVLDNTDPNNNKDLAALLEYVIPDQEGSLSFLYVYGQAPRPTGLTNVDYNGDGTNDATTTSAIAGAKKTRYHRLYLFADYTFENLGLKPLVGGGIGFDNQFISSIGTTSAALTSAASSKSWFAFAELDKKITDNVYALARFDYFDPTMKAEATGATRKTWYGTGGLVWSWQDHLRLAAEYTANDNKSQKLDHTLFGEAQFNF
ncbi:MAG: hypothetical protein HYY43_06470, partial [Deltaproteobacteria bacterium]|nr:hypothetical protein [Deltaproteobacteria bacterium]